MDVHDRPAVDAENYGLWLVQVMLYTMAVTLIVFSVAYIRDLNTLLTVPDAIWDAICGRPDPDSLTLPLLLTASTLLLIAGGGVQIWRRRKGVEG